MQRVKSCLTILFMVFSVVAWAQGSLTVVNFGGSYAKACQEGIEHPFVEATGIEIINEDYNGGLAQMRAQVEANSVHWDVVYLEAKDVLIACDEGIIEPIDSIEFDPAPDGTPAAEDFIPNTNMECGVSNVFYATYVAYDPRQFENREAPSKIDHLFDLENFPGRRGMNRNPHAVLEMALMADGVAPEDVYELLGSSSGVDQAFAKLDSIRDSIVWWEAGAQPPQMLADGEVSMTMAWNGRIFNAQVVEKQPFQAIWDGHVLDVGLIAAMADAPNKENALAFLKWSGRVESMLGTSSRIAYAPTRYSAAKLIDKHVYTGVDMSPYMPNAPGRTGRKLQLDLEFWADNQEDLTERFSAWLSR